MTGQGCEEDAIQIWSKFGIPLDLNYFPVEFFVNSSSADFGIRSRSSWFPPKTVSLGPFSKQSLPNPVIHAADAVDPPRADELRAVLKKMFPAQDPRRGKLGH